MSLDESNSPADRTDSAAQDQPGTNAAESEAKPPRRRGPGRRLRLFALLFLVLVLLATGAFFFGRYYIGKAMRADLPQLDGSLTVYGLAAPVTVQRDARGVPHIHAGTMDDLFFAQGYVTAQDRLWQMDLLRRRSSGQLAAIFGRAALDQDRLQRTLQMREAADRAVLALPADQRHWLEAYARGVNASIIAQRDHLPVEFRLLGYQPGPWIPRDSLLVELAMYQELTTAYPVKLGREALTAHLPPELIADLYPVGSWRDHYPGQPIPDVTQPQPDVPGVPLDESQTRMHPPAIRPAATNAADLLALEKLLALARPLGLFGPGCSSCVAGSNGWAVSGSRTASGKPMLSNDLHLSLSVPSLWYEADLEASGPPPMADFHAAGITLPGLPFVVAGHNAHVAWGFTNLGADVQDLYIEHTRGTPSGAEYQTAGGIWRPMRYQTEVIQVRGSANVILDVPLTRHGNTDTPIVSSIYANERRSLSLQWTIYDPANLNVPFFAVNLASDWTSMLSAFSTWGGPPLNLMYADDQGHIGYHAVGRIPLRGDVNNPSPLSPVPTDATAPDAATHEWVGYIPFDQLPQAFDPPDGVLATANSRVTPDGYQYPITLNWMAPYRTERIYKVLEGSANNPPDTSPGKVAQTLTSGHLLTPADMLALQNDVYSELDQVIAQRLAYSIDHAGGPLKDDKRLHQAADLLRDWNGRVDADAAAPAIVNATRADFWAMLLIPKLAPRIANQLAQGANLHSLKLPADVALTGNLWTSYTWGGSGYVEEQMMMHTPARWLPAPYDNWEDFLAAVVERGLNDAHAPADLSTWQQGKAYPVDIEHPIFSRSQLLQLLIAVPTGTGPQPKSGDGTTVKQIQRDFGPSDRFTADLGDPDHTTLDVVLGESGNPASPWYLDQFHDWLHGSTYAMPFTSSASQAAATHTLTLTPP